MNTPNPLLPQGALPPRERSSLYFKILMIFAVHIVVLGGILMVGCNPAKDKAAKADPSMDMAGGPAKTDPMSVTSPDIAPAPPAIAPTGPAPSLPGGSAAVPPAYTGGPVPVVAAVAQTDIAPPIPAITGGSVYTVAPGDTLDAIHKKTGVSVKAIQDANPGIDPKRLQIKAKLQIPASTATAGTDSKKAGADSTAAASGDSTIYIVKSGDILMKIAKAHNTSVKALEALNNMKTASIKAGDKLKVPVMKMASADAPVSTPAPTAPATGIAPSSAVRAN
jgi:LysM repeat protein